MAGWGLAISSETPYKSTHCKFMYWDVKKVKPLDDSRLYVETEDGRNGIFDVKPYLDCGVFAN